jgi:hypothetical protein
MLRFQPSESWQAFIIVSNDILINSKGIWQLKLQVFADLKQNFIE